MSKQILAISGSLRGASYNRALLKVASGLAPRDVTVNLYPDLDQMPPFSEDLEFGPVPLAVARLRQAIDEADGILIATPEYNGSIPGQLKNAIDWASRPARSGVLAGKAVATISASPSPHGAASAQADLRKVLMVAGASLVGEEVVVARVHERVDRSGSLLDEALGSRLTDVMAGFPVEPARRAEIA
jgi:chromate reductase, NAD(P)H dehydrogenase (quinone)